jgi:hypothetical protein
MRYDSVSYDIPFPHRLLFESQRSWQYHMFDKITARVVTIIGSAGRGCMRLGKSRVENGPSAKHALGALRWGNSCYKPAWSTLDINED